MTNPRILLAHEWLEPTGGSENTFAQMIEALPDSRVVSLWNNAPERFPTAEETFLARTWVRRSKPLSLAAMPLTWRSVDLTEIDTVVSSSHAMSHHLAGRAAREGRGAIAYVYSPPRYLWAPDLDVRGERPMARIGRAAFRRLDLRGIDSSVRYVGISHYVAARMRKAWGVDAEVVYPPVDSERLGAVRQWSDLLDEAEQQVLASLPEEFVLGASRLIEYKRLDVAMDVGGALGLPTVIAGDGPYRAQLESYAAATGAPVHFVGRVSDEMLFALYQRARLFVFMPIEDFGIMPVEAMALGTPALVRNTGGTAEIVEKVGVGRTASPDSKGELVEAARGALDAPAPPPGLMEQHFSNSRFRQEFSAMVRESASGRT